MKFIVRNISNQANHCSTLFIPFFWTEQSLLDEVSNSLAIIKMMLRMNRFSQNTEGEDERYELRCNNSFQDTTCKDMLSALKNDADIGHYSDSGSNECF